MIENIETVLLKMKEHIETNTWNSKYFHSKGNNNGFEKLIQDIIPNIEKQFLHVKFEFISGHHFPDVNVLINNEKFGIELKSSQKGIWYIPGNSIFEKISDNDYKDIYIFFGSRKKNSNKYEIKYKKYWQATENIAVTHSPRFIINMNSTTSIFNTNNDYEIFRKMNDTDKALFAQKILRNKTSDIKWYISPEPQATKVTNYKDLSEERKKQLITEVLILFPTDLLRKQNNYTRATNYLINQYYVYSKNLRDVFSAGGKINKNGTLIPKTLQTFIDYQPNIEQALAKANNEFKKIAYENWGMTPMNSFNEDYHLIVNNWVNNEFKKELNNLKINSIFDLTN